jgi:Prasinovirus endonuclease VII
MTIEQRRAKNAGRMRAWRARNPERANAIAAAGRRRNRAKIAASWKVYYKKNKAELYAKKKRYNARNPEKLRRWKHADYERHSESYKARAHKRWREKNEGCRAYEAKRYQRDKAIIFARHRDYARRNREKIRAWQWTYRKSPRGRALRQASDRRCVKRATAYKNKWARIRRRTDMSYRIAACLRARVGHALRAYQVAQRESVTASIRELQGCAVSELISYLESKFLPGMTRENYGRKGWHVDHIRPLCSFDLTHPEQRRVAFHYTNLQPLWASDNWGKGGRYDAAETTLRKAEPGLT